MIPEKYLLYLGHSNDEIGIKTSRGLAVFRPDACVGEFRHSDCQLTLGLPAMTMQQAKAQGAKTLILGITNPGGRLSTAMIEDSLAAVEAGLHVASGLHQRLREIPELVQAAARFGVSLIDVRDPPEDLPVGNGKPRAGKRLLTVGTDCSVGKMYTSLALVKALNAQGTTARFRATGQTGIMIAGSGIPLDAVAADFISGAIELLSPDTQEDGWDVIEGQGSLAHPSFAGVSTGLIHGAQPDAIILCHDPVREHMRGLPHFAMPDLKKCLAANLAAGALTNPNVQAVGVALNTSKLSAHQARQACAQIEDALGLPTTDPFSMGMDPIIERINQCFEPSKRAAMHSL